MPNMIETIIANGSCKTLVTALSLACLTDMLSGSEPFTLFAPNDDAFARLPKGALNTMLGDGPRLKQILSYHIVAGSLLAADVAKSPACETIEGRSLRVDSKKVLRVNDAKVVRPDNVCDNGVIHIIDGILNVPALKPATGNPSGLTQRQATASVPETGRDAGTSSGRFNSRD
ncbi:MAG: fasciclin domain-containing protein [Blastocatellia bacterium]